MTSSLIRKKYIEFFKARGHKEIASAPLVPENDPTTLFTSSGMQPLVEYLLGQPHPLGKRLVDSQKCFRSQDIEEVGDSSHITFFEMLGNWSLGDYFKKEQLPWIFEFLTKELGLDPKKLFVTVFEGNESVSKDTESVEIWKELFSGIGIDAKEGGRIFPYPASKNWWSRSGEPEKMPAGEPGGPDSEVFYDFGGELLLHEHSQFKNEPCHPNCQCGRFMEIGNSVFMQYQKQAGGILKELPQKNVDFGGGLERINAAVNNQPDIFRTDSFDPMIRIIESLTKKKYGENIEETRAMRVITDHIRGAVMMIADGVVPSNKTQGYVLRRLIRRALHNGKKIGLTKNWTYMGRLIEPVSQMYQETYPLVKEKFQEIKTFLQEEVDRFGKSLESGIREIENETSDIPLAVKYMIDDIEGLQQAMTFNVQHQFVKNISLLITKEGIINTFIIDGQKKLIKDLINTAKEAGMTTSFLMEDQQKENIYPTQEQINRMKEILEYFRNNPITLNSKWAFRFITTFGVPLEVLEEIMEEKDLKIDSSELDELMNRHHELSRTASAGIFKGGLAEHNVETTKFHTATHLLHQALRMVLGNHVSQKGSNITVERLRFDFSHPAKVTPEELKRVEDIVNEQIKKNLPVMFEELHKDDALKSGALGFFVEKYGDRVKVYTIGDPKGVYFSKEICGGPHINFTGELGHFTIIKEESAASGIRRIYARINGHEIV